jgi:lysophospholipase L1-like esterase
MDSPPARRIVCFGNSITEGAEFSPAQRWTTLLQQRLDEWRPKTWQVYRRGVGGHTSTQGLARFAADVRPLLPAIVLVEFGFNDANVYDWTASPRVALADYVANLREMHRLVVSNGECIFIINHSIGAIDGRQGNGQSYNDNFAPYEAALRELAAQLGAPSIDLPALMREVRADPARFLAEDGLHLCVEGNRLYAGLVFGALKPLLTGNLQKAI